MPHQDNTRKAVDRILSILIGKGWQRDDIVDAVTRSFPTAVGPRTVAIWALPRHGNQPGVRLTAEYWSEGRNALGTHTLFLPLDQCLDPRARLDRFLRALHTAVDNTCARRLALQQHRQSASPAP